MEIFNISLRVTYHTGADSHFSNWYPARQISEEWGQWDIHILTRPSSPHSWPTPHCTGPHRSDKWWWRSPEPRCPPGPGCSYTDSPRSPWCGTTPRKSCSIWRHWLHTTILVPCWSWLSDTWGGVLLSIELLHTRQHCGAACQCRWNTGSIVPKR